MEIEFRRVVLLVADPLVKQFVGTRDEVQCHGVDLLEYDPHVVDLHVSAHR